MGRFFYELPSLNYNEDGNMEIIHKYCVGPIEIQIYGINQNKEFYFDWTYPEFYPDDTELERDYRVVSKERILKAINLEIEKCLEEENIKLAEKYKNAIEMIESGNY